MTTLALQGAKSGRLLTVGVFSLTMFLSAAAMFALQPMVGKMLLPIVGGTPAGWIVAMAFFQIMLLIGYCLAFGLARLTPRQHGISFIACLLLGTVFLPVHLTAPEETSMTAIGTFLLLCGSVGIPFIALSATSTTIQRLFAATGDPSADDPYFLYAASNLGSFTGLLLYPFFIEPHFTLGWQAKGWFAAYALLIAMAAAALTFAKDTRHQVQAAKPAIPITNHQRLMWVLYAFIPSSLLMGYTTYITNDIYSAPLIWILPLGIYLLTFVVAFSKRSKRLTTARLDIYALSAIALSLALNFLVLSNVKSSMNAAALHLVNFGVIALALQMRLVDSRPTGDDRRMTEFYLMMALGGALGGCFNAFIAPVIFNRTIELPLILLAAIALHPSLNMQMTSRQIARTIAGTVFFSFYLMIYDGLLMHSDPHSPLAIFLVFWHAHPGILPMLLFSAPAALALVLILRLKMQKELNASHIKSVAGYTAALFLSALISWTLVYYCLLAPALPSDSAITWGAMLRRAIYSLGIYALLDCFGALALLLVSRHAKPLLLIGATMFILMLTAPLEHIVRFERNFYGSIKVYDLPLLEKSTHKPVLARYMSHGTTLHGFQLLAPGLNTIPTSYYSYEGPLGGIFQFLRPKKIMALGLGVGTLNCYSAPDNEISFIDIDPAVIDIAQHQFSYLKDCSARNPPRIITGDARLEMQKLKDEKFDLIVVDVFSSDYVPAHLMTLEGIRVYLDRLSEHGMIAFHVSNRFFDLNYPLAAAADKLDLQKLAIVDSFPQNSYQLPSKWIVMTRHAEDLKPLRPLGWYEPTVRADIPYWTDDYSNFLSIMAVERW